MVKVSGWINVSGSANVEPPTGYWAIQVHALKSRETRKDARYDALPVVGWLEPAMVVGSDDYCVRAYAAFQDHVFVVQQGENGWHFNNAPLIPRKRLEETALALRRQARKRRKG